MNAMNVVQTLQNLFISCDYGIFYPEQSVIAKPEICVVIQML